ncbi:MAG: hypothetical protein K6G62_03900 [Eubacterium sp.]|nr:hypothetical protein [Eubacterium sp.]
MKKFLKVLLGLVVFAAAVAGVIYFIKNVLMKDYLEDYDDDDFDNDLYDDGEDRDYVTLTPEEKAQEDDIDEDDVLVEDADLVDEDADQEDK